MTGEARSLHELEAGCVLDGRYRLVQRIGRGGFGDVWRAVELLPDGAPLRDVALKLLAPQLGGSGWAEEAKLLASFSHPSLVTIYATGILGDLGAPFVAMELLLGETLAEVLRRRGKLPWRAALRYARDVAAALDVIHARGVVHLDLKPANLFVTAGGALKVLDFGISRSAHGMLPRDRVSLAEDPALMATAALSLDKSDPFAMTLIASGSGESSESGRIVVGTPGFVAPEVLELGEPTRLADAYALGTTIALLISGQLPHDVSVEPPDDSDDGTLRAYFAELREATLSGRLRDLRAEAVPAGVAALVERLSARDPAARAGESLSELLEEAWARPHGVPARPYPGPRPFSREHEGFLFGREAELTRISSHLAVESVVAVSGPRGAGKTSFVAALLLPELAKARVDGRLDCRVATADLGAHPDQALDQALSAIGAARVDAEDEEVGGDVALLAGLATGDDVGTIVVLDGLERLVDAEPSRRGRTVQFLVDALAAKRIDGLRIVLLVDQEHVDAVTALAPGLGVLPSVVRYLAPPPAAAARDIAIAPARHAGWEVHDADKVAAMVEAELARARVPLPAIGIALEALAHPATRALGPSEPIAKAIWAHADRVVAGLGPAERAVALEALLALTTSDGQPITRSVSDAARLAGDDPAESARMIERLVSALVVERTRGEVTLGHPSLTRWDKLENARLASMNRLAARERLAAAADAWDRADRKVEYLDRDGLTAELEQQGPATRRALRPVDEEFLRASRRARRRRVMIRASLVAVALILGAGILLGNRALNERRLAAERAQKEATRRAAITEIVSRARGASDPYARVAYLAEALRLEAPDPALPIELLAAAHELAPVRFLTRDGVDRPMMPWGSRWVVGTGADGALVVIDLEPRESEPELVEHVDVDLDAKRLELLYRRPKLVALAVGSAPVVDVAPLPYDTAVFARNALGEVHLVRLRESGQVALAAVAPMRCRGGLAVAARAPVLACTSDAGVAVWDVRKVDAVRFEEPAGALALSPDGSRLGAWMGRELSVRAPFEPSSSVVTRRTESDILLAAFGPREPLLAVAQRHRLQVFDLGEMGEGTPPIFEVASLEDPVGIRWDDAGLDLALCKLSGQATHYFLRPGRRPPDEPKPSGRCDRVSPDAPRLVARGALGDFASRSAGEHFARAFELARGRALSTSMVLAVVDDDRLERHVEFSPRDEEGRPLEPAGAGSIAALVRQDGIAVVQRARRAEEIARQEAPDLVVVEAHTGRRRQKARGHLLAACPDGRIASWRADGARWTVSDVRSGAVLGVTPRTPGAVVGISPSCAKLYTQRLDGGLFVHALSGETEAPGRLLVPARGYVFDVEASQAWGPSGAGLLLAFSSGEIVRLDERDDTVRLLAHASPRASALADGPVPGEALFVDGLGLFRVDRAGVVSRVVEGPSGAPWEDAAVVRDGAAVVLASVKGLSVVDLESRAVVGFAPVRGRTRLLAWGSDGALLAYAPDIQGISSGVVVPYGRAAPVAIGALASNLRVGAGGALELKR